MTARVLYVTHRVPWPPDRGDRIRTWNVLKFLSARAKVDVACLADEPVSDDTLSALRGVTRRLAIVPHAGRRRYVRGLMSLACGRTITAGLFESSALRQIVRAWSDAESYDAVLASSSGVASYILPPTVSGAPTRWVDLIDVDSQKWLDYSRSARWPMSTIYGLEGRRVRRVEQQLSRSCDQLLVVSEAERELFRSFCATEKVAAVGNGVDADYFAPAASSAVEPASCVFVGVMNYKPNADAVLWFADQVWPSLRQRYPQAMFRIVGKSPGPEVSALGSRAGIEVTGSVSDVRPYLHRSSCVVVPLQIARGVQNKVLEALACGRPVVCSPEPLKGLRVTRGLHLLEADSPEAWIAAVSRVFDDASLRADLGLAGSEFVRQHHAWEQCLSHVSALIAGCETVRRDDCEVSA